MKKTQQKLWLMAAIFSTLMLVLSLGYWSRRLFSRHNQNLNSSTAAEAPQKNFALPVHILIKNVADIPIESLLVEGDNLPVSDTMATYTLNSARPGETGNVIIYGHNSNHIFGRMKNLKGGERVVVTTQDGKKHEYFVSSVREYGLDQTYPLYPTEEETLTLYTCAGFFDSKRLVVRAVPQQPETISLERYRSVLGLFNLENESESQVFPDFLSLYSQ